MGAEDGDVGRYSAPEKTTTSRITANMTLGDGIVRNGARPVKTRQAGAAPDSAPRGSPPPATGGPFSTSWGARGRGRRATGRKSKVDESPITIVHWNAEGVTNKKTELEQYLHQHNINICCLQETHLQEGKPFKIRGYQVFRSDRQGRRKGGVATLVRNNINASESRRYMDEAEYIEVKVTLRDSTFNIVNYYCPDDKMLSLDTLNVPDSGYLIVGDFNSQSQSWGYNTMDRRGEEVETWQDEHHLILINDPTDTPTFYSRRWHSTTTPDLALCTEDVHKKISRTVESQLGGSDHRPVLLTITGRTEVDPPQHARWNYKKAQWGLFSIRSNELTKHIAVDGRNINNVVKEFNNNIVRAAKEAIPRGVRKNYTPYWTAELQKAHDELTQAREEAEANANQDNNIKLQEKKATFLKIKLESKRRSWREKTTSLCMERDTTKLWKLTKALNEEGAKGQKITLVEDGETLTGKKAGNLFASAYAKESSINVPAERKKEIRREEEQRSHDTNVHNSMKKDITLEELKKALKKLKKKKSPGPDDITNEMLQHLGNVALNKLLDIFNLSWRQGQVPQCWKEARMIPVLKKGKNKSKSLSYRPISLTSCVCKAMERILNQRLQWYLEEESIILPEQAGFRSYRCTEDQTTHLAQVIEDAFQAQKVVLAVFIDLQKAFDKVWKDGLLVKLKRSGISGNMYKWVRSYLHNRRARVLVDGRYSRKVLLRHGVPQGGVLSPTMFVLFINDLVPELPKGVHAALYADDLVLWCTEEYTTTATHRMQLALDKVSAWANDWCVSINREKTTATLFSLSTKAIAGRLTIGGTPLTFEDQQTYLGVTFDRRQTWKQHILTAEAKARRKLNIMRKLAGTQWGATEKILKTVYQGSVRPHLEYGSSSFMTAAKTHLQTLDKVQNQALRIITGAMKTTPIEKMEKITGIPPLAKRRECKALTQAMKYTHSSEHLMSKRQKQSSLGRLKRSSFVSETKVLQRVHQEKLPTKVEPQVAYAGPPPWEERENKITICTTVPHFTKKDEHSDVSKKALTMAMLDETYPHEAWIRVYTDGSATDAIQNGGAGVFIQYPDGQWQAEAVPTGHHCTNYRAEIEALVLAANIISSKVSTETQVVFLTDALSVLQAVSNDSVPRLQEALQTIKCLRAVLQWIPSHCGIEGNEEADKMAKLGAEDEQEENSISLTEMKTIIKSLYRTHQQNDGYHHMSRPQQVTIFRLRTGHNRLMHHMHQKLHLVPSPMCSCGDAEQTTEHILQDCRNLQSLRDETWPEPKSIHEKLYGPVEELKRTTTFITRAALQV
jgi:ribonuclease HI